MKYVIQFFLSGTVITLVSYLSTQIHTKYAAILYAIPLQFTLILVFTSLNAEKKTVQQLSVDTLKSLILTFIFIFTFSIISKYFDFWIAMSVSYVIFILLALLFIKYI